MKSIGIITLCSLISTFISQVFAGPVMTPAMLNTAIAGPVLTPAMLNTAAVLAPPCLCNGVPTPVLFGDLCLCGCELMKSSIDAYSNDCPDSKFYEFNKGIEANCKGIENTEDCEYFKKFPDNAANEADKKIPDAFKKCKDNLDSIKDDCENCKECTIVGKKEEEDKEKNKDD